MIQEFLMWTSVIGAFGYTTFSMSKIIWDAYKKKEDSCGGACGGCDAKHDLLKKIKRNEIKPLHFN